MSDPVAAALALWLRSNGAPALIPRRGLLLVLVGPLLLIGFMLRSLVQTVLRRSSSMLQVVPLLLVALTLSFFSTEVWQTIGRLHGLPLVLTTLLFVALAAAFATRQGRLDLDSLAVFADASDLRAALPARLANRLVADTFDAAAAPRLRRRERTNLLVISVLSQVVTAAVIAGIVFAFFVVLGVLTVDRSALVSWLWPRPANRRQLASRRTRIRPDQRAVAGERFPGCIHRLLPHCLVQHGCHDAGRTGVGTRAARASLPRGTARLRERVSRLIWPRAARPGIVIVRTRPSRRVHRPCPGVARPRERCQPGAVKTD